jgi:hypothetical protein
LLGNGFRRTLKPKSIGEDELLCLRLALSAAKLGLPSRILQINPTFFTFACKNALHRYLYLYNHDLRWDDHDSSIQILFEGTYHNWANIEYQIKRLPDDRQVMAGQYSAQGIVNRSLTAWTSLQPFLRALSPASIEDPHNISKGTPVFITHDWGNRYILDICSWILEKPRLSGDHMWMRIKNPGGQIYSFGLYREKKDLTGGGFPGEQVLFPMKIQRSEFQSPDICEFWGDGSYSTLSIEITVPQI